MWASGIRPENNYFEFKSEKGLSTLLLKFLCIILYFSLNDILIYFGIDEYSQRTENEQHKNTSIIKFNIFYWIGT